MDIQEDLEGPTRFACWTWLVRASEREVQDRADTEYVDEAREYPKLADDVADDDRQYGTQAAEVHTPRLRFELSVRHRPNIHIRRPIRAGSLERFDVLRLVGRLFHLSFNHDRLRRRRFVIVLVRRVLFFVGPLNLNRAIGHHRCHGANGGPDREQQCAREPDGHGKLDEDPTLVVLDDDVPHVPFVQQLLELCDDLVAFDLEFLAHRRVSMTG